MSVHSTLIPDIHTTVITARNWQHSRSSPPVADSEQDRRESARTFPLILVWYRLFCFGVLGYAILLKRFALRRHGGATWRGRPVQPIEIRDSPRSNQSQEKPCAYWMGSGIKLPTLPWPLPHLFDQSDSQLHLVITCPVIRFDPQCLLQTNLIGCDRMWPQIHCQGTC